MSTESMSEILEKAANMVGREAKIEYLKRNNSLPLRNLLALTYNTALEYNIPNERPPFTPSEHADSHGLLYREIRKMKYFVKGYGGDHIDQPRREAMFIQMLETVEKNDAELLINMLEKKPIPGLTTDIILAAFGPLYPAENGADNKAKKEPEKKTSRVKKA